MDLKKALISSVILYALIFVVASGLMFVFPVGSLNFRMSMPIIAAVLTYLIASYYYFKGVSVSSPLTDGFMLGLVFVVVAFILDTPLMVYGFQKELGWAYFAQWNLMLGYLLTLIVSIVAAYMKK